MKITRRRKLYLSLEFLALFFGLPGLIVAAPVKVNPLPILWATALALTLVLRADRSFDRSKFVWSHHPKFHLQNMFIRFGLLAVALIALVAFLWPQNLFDFPRRSPFFWALVMLLYPILSVYPQGILHRLFLFHRYKPLFGGPTLTIFMSALAFSFMHIIFKNPVALGLTFIGGLMFARTYYKTDSLLISGLEHALYGDLLFTIGLGQFIYHGAIR